jgi:hypothetical protein
MNNTPSTLTTMEDSDVAEIANKSESEISNRMNNFIHVVDHTTKILRNLRAFDPETIKKALLDQPTILNSYLEQARLTRMSIGNIFCKFGQERCDVSHLLVESNKTKESTDLIIYNFFIALKDCRDAIDDLLTEPVERINAELSEHQNEYPPLKGLFGNLVNIDKEIDFFQRSIPLLKCKGNEVAEKTPKKPKPKPNPKLVTAEEVINSFCELYRFPESPVYRIDEKYKLAYSRLMGHKLFVVDENHQEKQAYQALYNVLKKGRIVENAVIVAAKGESNSTPIAFYLVPKEVLIKVKSDDASVMAHPKSANEKELADKAIALRERIEENESIFENDLEYRIAHAITEHMEDGNRGYTYRELLEFFEGQIIPQSKLAQHLKSLKETLRAIGIELKGNLIKGGLKRIRLEWITSNSGRSTLKSRGFRGRVK